ncbi:MAG: hypothetical protein LBH96_06165 [Candidatus Peribacteria bacterium]|nr:hypothetical protein [Candidatus Peribacteria bacterium]
MENTETLVENQPIESEGTLNSPIPNEETPEEVIQGETTEETIEENTEETPEEIIEKTKNYPIFNEENTEDVETESFTVNAEQDIMSEEIATDDQPVLLDDIIFSPSSLTSAITTYSGCDTPDITFSGANHKFTIAACNIGATKAGTGYSMEISGKKFQRGTNTGYFDDATVDHWLTESDLTDDNLR